MRSPLACVCFLLITSVVGINSSANLTNELNHQVVVRHIDDLRRPAYRALSKAQGLVDSDKDQKAISHLDKFLERKKKLNTNELAQIHHMRAFAYYKLGDYGSAIRAYLLVIDKPDRIHIDLERQTYNAIAQLYVGLENNNLAKQWYIAWLDIGANANWEDYKEIAVVAAFDQDIETAFKYANEAIAGGMEVSGYLPTELLSVHRYASDQMGGNVWFEGGFQDYHNKNHIKVIELDSSFIDALGMDATYVGSINLRYRLSSSGRVTNPEVLYKSDEILPSVVLEKLKTHKFEPVIVQGKPSNVVLNERIAFGENISSSANRSKNSK